MPTILLGTSNHNKRAELSELLLPFGISICTLADFDVKPEVVEDGTSFIENARKKAVEYARFFKMPTIADDSGVSVEVLDGAPGIYSSRFAATPTNPNPTSEANNKLLLERLASVPAEQRAAFYTCAAVFAASSGEIICEAEQYCRGRIIFELSGNEGFGYDPLFEIIEYHKTFGSICPAIKKAISHRARAMRKLIPIIIQTKW
ncbi:MAG: non-canonical purine NTP pyrophosphatase [Planctomycetaceae bacterium]|jgi:XTP/dITP diphosphohydrolase|nr:non-canonical purine NTP pyrophosphatase [Planctomycetaceae bacterium]